MSAQNTGIALDGESQPNADSTDSGDGTLTTIPYLDRKVAPRYVFKVDTKIVTANREGKGTIWDISSSGARIERATVQPIEGERLTIEFSFFKNSPPVQLTGKVVRMTENGGFAMEFSQLTPRLQQILRRLLPKVASARVAEGNEQATIFSGKLRTDIGPSLHRACAEAARAAGLDMNSWLKQQLERSAKEELSKSSEHGAKDHDPETCVDCRRKAAQAASG